MVYREVHMIEIKEILTRIAGGQSIRSISNALGIHRDTIRNYFKLAIKFGFSPGSKDSITDELVLKVRRSLFSPNTELPERDNLLLPVKDKIEQYLKKGIKGSKIIILLARQGIYVKRDSFYRFTKQHCESVVRKNITVRLPETEPGVYAQADFGTLGKLWDKVTGKEKLARALVITLCYSRHMYIYITFSQDIGAVIAGFEAAWAYFGGIVKLVIVDNIKAIIDKPDRVNPIINKSFLEYAQYRGFILDPANIGHAKGKDYASYCTPPLRLNFC